MHRILFYYSSYRVDTGSPRALLSQIALIDRQRFQPVFLASGDGPLLAALRSDGVEVLHAPVSALSWRQPIEALRHLIAMRKWLRQSRIDLVHVNQMGWNYDFVLAAKSLGIPVVIQLHLPGGVALQNLHWLAASRVLLVSAAQRDTIEHFERFRCTSDVLYSPVDVAYYSGGRDIRRDLGLAADDIVVCTIAQLRVDKGIEQLVEVAQALRRQYPRLRFVVVGPLGHGEEEFGRRMMAAAAPGGAVEGVLRFVGSRDDVPDILASSDLFLFPSRAETFGRAVVEAMAAGLPVVATRIPALEEIITRPEMGVLVSPPTGSAFAEAVGEVLERMDCGRSMGLAGKQGIVGRFDADTIGRQLNRLYLELVSPRSP